MMRKFSTSMVLLPTFALAAVVGLAGLSTAAETYRKLSEPQIKSRLAGMELTDDVHFSEQYMRDGTLRMVTMGRRAVGKWLVKNGQLCLETPRPEDARCTEVWLSGNKVQLRWPDIKYKIDAVLQKQTPRGW